MNFLSKFNDWKSKKEEQRREKEQREMEMLFDKYISADASSTKSIRDKIISYEERGLSLVTKRLDPSKPTWFVTSCAILEELGSSSDKTIWENLMKCRSDSRLGNTERNALEKTLSKRLDLAKQNVNFMRETLRTFEGIAPNDKERTDMNKAEQFALGKMEQEANDLYNKMYKEMHQKAPENTMR